MVYNVSINSVTDSYVAYFGINESIGILGLTCDAYSSSKSINPLIIIQWKLLLFTVTTM